MTFESNGGPEIATQTVNYNEKANKPADLDETCGSEATWYSDEKLTKPYDFDTVITRDITLYAKWDTQHKNGLTEVEAKKPTCEEAGNTHYWTCEDCGRYYSDEAGTKEITIDKTVLDALGHTPAKEHEKEQHQGDHATCTEPGTYIEIVRCARNNCGKIIYRGDGESVEPPLGHNWGDWVDQGDGTKIRTCLNGCGETQTDIADHEHILTKIEKVEPLCTSQGKQEHYKCDICGKLFWDEKAEQLIEDEGALGIPALGHDTKNCERVIVSETEPTCNTDGVKVQLKKCNRCKALVGTPEVITINALGHDWEMEYKEGRIEATCTEAGSFDADGRCNRCGLEIAFHGMEENPKGHILTEHEAVSPTCDTDGNSRYWTCDTCGKYFSDKGGLDEIEEADTIVAKLNRHEGGEPVQENRVDATTTSAGGYDEVVRCIYCGDVLSRKHVEIPQLQSDEYNINIKTSVEDSDEENGGSVETNVKGKGKKGNKYTITAKPRPGYEFLYWLTGGKTITRGTKYNLQVNANDSIETVEVEAVFAPALMPYGGGISLGKGETYDLAENAQFAGSVQPGVSWESADTGIATVDANGKIKAVAAGSTRVTGRLQDGTILGTFAVVVESGNQPDNSGSAVKVGDSVKYKSNTYKVTSVASKTVALTKAKNAKSVSVPATVVIKGETFKVTQINAKAFTGKKIKGVTVGKNVKTIKTSAFKGSKATKLVVKSKSLTKKSVKNSLKGSKIKTVKVKVGKKSVNKKYVKKYKKIFTKKNAGKKVTVK